MITLKMRPIPFSKVMRVSGDGRLFCYRNNETKGFSANFLSLVCNNQIDAEFYGFSDQDDIWEAGKLQRAVDWLRTIPKEAPALYCARTLWVNESKEVIGLSPLCVKVPSFANALAQNIGGGNTMVFNRAARLLLKEAGDDLHVLSHDWWTYLVISGCGGKVLYDPEPVLKYRQHSKSEIGAKNTWAGRFSGVRRLCQGYVKEWISENIRALQTIQHRLTPDTKIILDRFLEARSASIIHRLQRLRESGIYRQTLCGNVGLVAGAIWKKL